MSANCVCIECACVRASVYVCVRFRSHFGFLARHPLACLLEVMPRRSARRPASKDRPSKDRRPASTPDLGDFGFVRQVPPILLALIFKYFELLLDADFSVRREYMSVELFAGEQAISKAVRKMYPAASFDKRYGLNQDLATAAGFALALNLVLKILNHGMLWAAPVCSSWVWISRSRTGRSALNASGDLKHLSVRIANRMVDFTVLLIVVAYARGVEVYLEQPCS